MSAPSVLTHDFTLSDGTTPLGFRATKGKDGSPKMVRRTRRTFADQQFTQGDLSAFRLGDKAFWNQEDWQGGFGKQKAATLRYQASLGVDASYPGLLCPGPVPVATTKSTPTYAATATIANGGFETGDLTSWTEVSAGNGAWDVAAAALRSGSYGARCTYVNDSSAQTPELKQQFVAADSSLFGSTGAMQLAASAYGRMSGAPAVACTLQLVLKDGSGTVIATGSAVAITEAGWTEATVSHTFTDGWPQLWLHVKVSRAEGGGDTASWWVDDVTRTITSGSISTAADMGTIVKLVEFNTAHYAVSETGVWKRTTNNWARIAGSPDAITDAVTDGTNLYLARGTSKNYWYMAAGETFTRNTGTGNSSQIDRFCWAGGSMFGARGQQTLYTYSTLSSGAVSDTDTVGATGYEIRSLLSYNELPYVFTEKQVDYRNSSGNIVANIIPQLNSAYDANTGKQAISFNGSIYTPAGAQDLVEYDADANVTFVSPALYAERLGDYAGQVVALAEDGAWLFAVVDNATKIEILKGRRQTLDGTTPETDFRWHPFVEDTYATVGYAMVSTVTAKRLWYGGGTALPKYIPLTTKYADPLNDTALTFQTGVTWISPWITLGFPNVSKTWVSCTLDSLSLADAAQTVKVEYKKLGDSSWTELGGSSNGTYGTAATGTQEKFFETGSSAVKSTALQLRLTFTSNDTSKGFGVTRILLYAVLNPVKILEFEVEAVVMTHNAMRDGQEDMEMTAGKIMPTLIGWRSTHPLTLTWPDGTDDGQTYTVKFDEEGGLQDVPVDASPESQEQHKFLVAMRMVETRTS